MEQVESISFSGLIAGMLLYRRCFTSVEVTNILSKLGEYGIIVDDENDDFGIISCCVEMDKNYGFCLKYDFSYDSFLYPGIDVSTFLRIHTNENLLSLIKRSMDDYYSQKVVVSQVPVIKDKKENLIISLFKTKVLSRKKTGSNNFL